jgi:hypothetical protein
MRILSSMLLSLTLGTYPATSLAAQEREVKQPQPPSLIGLINDVDVTVTDLTEEKLNNPPKREIKSERLEEPLKQKLTRPDPKLLLQKHAASFRLVTPTIGINFVNAISRDSEVSQLQVIGEHRLLSPQYPVEPGFGGTIQQQIQQQIRAQAESFGRMIKFLPKDTKIAKEELDFFADPQNLEGCLTMSPIRDNQSEIAQSWRFVVLGATPEEAEKRATALLTLLDDGAFRPIRLEIFKIREPLCQQIREQRKMREAAKQSSNAAEEQLKSYVDYTPDMLSNLRVQQLQLEVELAGVQARIATCEKFLAQPNLKAERRNQLEDVKVSAEIELSGFEARRMKSEEFIRKVKTKNVLTAKSDTANSAYINAQNSIQNLERQIRNIDAAIHAYAPLPLVDNKIVVQPLEWTQ